MHVLMIGLGPDVLTTDSGDARARHVAYAAAAGRLTMIVSSFRRDAVRPAQLTPHLAVIPTNSRNRWTFVVDALREGRRICRSGSVDLVVTQDPFATGLIGYILKRRYGMPLIMGNHSQFLDNPHWIAEHPIRYRLFNRLAYRLIHAADALRVVNPVEGAKYVRAGVREDRVYVLPTPVPLDRFLARVPPDRIADVRARIGAQGPLLLWVGNPAQTVKDLPTLFAAFGQVRAVHPDAMLALAGDFSRSPHAVQAAAPDARSGICFLGHVAHADLPAVFQASDLYVHSSRYEGLAKVMVEAAASGVPVVTTHVPGVEAVIENGITGLITPAGDARALARGILTLLRDAPRRHLMGQRARELAVARFSRGRQIDAIVSMWRDVAARAGSRPENA